MKRPSAMWPQRMRLTCWQSSAGSAASVANARTAAWRFDISSAAGMPLPTTSAIESPRRDEPKAMASKQSPPTPDAGCHDTASSQPSSVGMRRRQQLALDAPRFVELAAFDRDLLPSRAPRLDLGPQHTHAAVALSHGFCTKLRTPRRIASTAMSTDPQPVMTTIGSSRDRAPARARAGRCLRARRSCRRCSSGPSTGDRTCPRRARTAPHRASRRRQRGCPRA